MAQPLHGVQIIKTKQMCATKLTLNGVMVGTLPLHQKEREKKPPAAVLTVKAGHSW